MADPTAIDIEYDPRVQRISGVATHGLTPFDVPYISYIGDNLWQGGCADGLMLPEDIDHVVSVYPWERYEMAREISSELYVEMYDSVYQGFEQIDAIATWINVCRKDGPVLVHCQAGLNRSSLVTARALYMQGGMSGADIVAHLRNVRSPAVLCNPAFAAEVASWN
ncbi:protein-tyrosine phosphatase family protein [Mycolicibacterium palauense]|uniref:protein-tyrosine phosphatase family protein n=1 Tax=Mycolicibacterium palauense TaxID=2034511 RepID=UPI000BFF18D1|nr:dual specificity protein phosphatase family protein [Mycolicibacterium palauense]